MQNTRTDSLMSFSLQKGPGHACGISALRLTQKTCHGGCVLEQCHEERRVLDHGQLTLAVSPDFLS